MPFTKQEKWIVTLNFTLLIAIAIGLIETAFGILTGHRFTAQDSSDMENRIHERILDQCNIDDPKRLDEILVDLNFIRQTMKTTTYAREQEQDERRREHRQLLKLFEDKCQCQK